MRGLGHRRWFRGDLHCHTVHSDGTDGVATVLAAAARIGLDFLAVTDHNTDSHLPHLAAAGADVLAIPGEEITTYAGHANAVGISAWVDFRGVTPAEMSRSVDAAHAQGALVSVNHPRAEAGSWELGDEPSFDAVEVWNGPWKASDDDALAWWRELLADGRTPTAVGGSDMHSFDPADQPIGTPVTWVLAATLESGAIVEGIRAGRVFMSRDPIGPLLELRVATSSGAAASIGESLLVTASDRGALDVDCRIRGGGGMMLQLLSDRGVEAETTDLAGDHVARFAVPAAGRRHIRLEVRTPAGAMAALSNPIHLVEDT